MTSFWTTKVLVPFGVSTATGLPGFASLRARPIGDSAERRPWAGSASVEPTRVHVLTSPLPSSRTSAVRPKAKASAAPVALDHDGVFEPQPQSLYPVSRCAWSSLAM